MALADSRVPFRPEDWLTLTEAAAAKGMSRQGLFEAIGAQRFPALMFAGRWIIHRADLAAWTPARRGPKPRRKAQAEEAPEAARRNGAEPEGPP